MYLRPETVWDVGDFLPLEERVKAITIFKFPNYHVRVQHFSMNSPTYFSFGCSQGLTKALHGLEDLTDSNEVLKGQNSDPDGVY